MRRRSKQAASDHRRPTILNFFERFGYGVPQRPRTAFIQGKSDIFEAPDEIDDFAARDWSAGRCAKVRAAAERPIFVDQAIACFLLKHWARSISIFRERFSSGGAKRIGRDDRFTFRQTRSASGQFEMTTFSPAQAIALDRPLRKIDINLSHFIQRSFFQE